MHPSDCPAWEYDTHPDRLTVLRAATDLLLGQLFAGRLDAASLAGDSRQAHHTLFHRLTPYRCDYYAGHYRGENYRCLRFLRVGIASDRRVGFEPDQVLPAIVQLSIRVRLALSKLDQLSDEFHQLLQAVSLAAEILELLLRIHPYANGNGHIARLAVVAILARYNYRLRNWPVEPRPEDPPYVQLIVAYRSGNHQPLEDFLLRQILASQNLSLN